MLYDPSSLNNVNFCNLLLILSMAQDKSHTFFFNFQFLDSVEQGCCCTHPATAIVQFSWSVFAQTAVLGYDSA